MFHPLSSSFLAIFDSEGDIQDVYSVNSVRDEVFRRCEILDSQFPECSPHTAWEYRGGDWCLLKEQIHSNQSVLRLSTPIKRKPTTK